MQVKPELIQSLHRILRQKSDVDTQLARGPRRVQACQNVENDAVKQLELAQQELKRLKLVAADKQLQLKQRETKLEDLKGKRNTCNSNREFSLLNDQIAADQQANTVLADEILETLEAIDRQNDTIKLAMQRVEQTKTETLKIQTDVQQRSGVLQSELARINADLNECVAQLPADVRSEYQHRVRSKADEALAMVESGSCGNCHQILTAHVLDQLSLGRVHICSSCNAMLYMPERIGV
jgi:predicted  nucleic acid-binding Zn-ribbon protein